MSFSAERVRFCNGRSHSGHKILGYSLSYLSNPHSVWNNSRGKTFTEDTTPNNARNFRVEILTKQHHLARTRLLDLLAIFQDVCFWTCLKIDSFFSASWDGNLVATFQPLACSRMMKQPMNKVNMAWTCLNIFPKLSEDTGFDFEPKTSIISGDGAPPPNTWTWFYDWSHLLNYWTLEAQ